MATKKSTAKTSRNGRRRRRASLASWLSVTARPPTNAARASGTPKTAAPTPARARPDPTEVIRNRSCSSRSRLRTRGSRRRAATMVTTPNPASPSAASPSDRPPGSMTDSRIAARATPTMSCMTAQPTSASSVGRSVVRRRLRVMLTMTIDDDSATDRPMTAAAIGSRPVTRKATTGDDGRDDDLGRPGQQHRAVVASQLGQVDLDADLEQEQHDPDVGQQLELLAVRDVARRERREAQPDRQVADDRGEVQAARQPAGGDRGQEDEADLEDGRRVGVHPGMVAGQAGASASPSTPPAIVAFEGAQPPGDEQGDRDDRHDDRGDRVDLGRHPELDRAVDEDAAAWSTRHPR